jgi:hypothetical protein
MLKSPLLLALLIASLVINVALFVAPYNWDNDKYFQPQSSSNSPSQSKPGQSSGQSNDGQHNSGSVWDWLLRDAAGFFTMGLVAVGSFQVGLFVWQLILIRRSLKPTERAAIAATTAAEHIPRVERAYLFLWHELKYKITPNAGGAIPGQILEVQFAFRNHGKTPAILRRIEADIRVVEAYPTTLREIATDMPSGLILSADEKTPFFPHRQLIQPEHWTDVQRRQRLLLFLGRVDYRDIFGNNHKTGFCFEWDGNGFTPSSTETLNYYT